MDGPLGDVWLGSPDAKCTIIEYASMTCTHCAAFHRETWPKLKSTYIDTGKVHFTLREFPLDRLAAAGFMLARCAGNDKYFALTDLLFDKQEDWAFIQEAARSLGRLDEAGGFHTEKLRGMFEESADSCWRRSRSFARRDGSRRQCHADLLHQREEV